MPRGTPPGASRGRYMTRKHRVRVIETGEVYDSVQECAEAIGGNIHHIYHVIAGTRESHKGHTFAWHGWNEPENRIMDRSRLRSYL